MTKKNTSMAIVHEHYHFADIGVKTVLDCMMKGINSNFDNYSQYFWYSPYKYQDRNEPFEKYQGGDAKPIEDTQLGYLSKKFEIVDDFLNAVHIREQQKLEHINYLLSLHQKVIHMIQNPTLLKNPVETHANISIAKKLENENYIQLWHIHDLLEDSSSRAKLRKHIQTLAGDKTGLTFGENGSGICWNQVSNIFYITINKKDKWALENFIFKGQKDIIHCLPNPLDFIGYPLSPCSKDRYSSFDDQLINYCESQAESGFTYIKNTRLLIAAEMARERKNSVEQLLILKLLNANLKNGESPFQLLVTMLPSQKEDMRRIDKIKEYLLKNKANVCMGFGRELINKGAERSNDQITIVDLWNHPNAYAEISTSVKEGFGLNFIHPSSATQGKKYPITTIGRSLEDIFSDFRSAGLYFPEDAFYHQITIEPSMLLEKYHNSCDDHIFYTEVDLSSYDRITPPKTILLGQDFASYTIDEQLFLLDCIDYHILGKKMAGLIRFISSREKMSRIAKENALIAKKSYSIEAYVKKIDHIIDIAFSHKKARQMAGDKAVMISDNSDLIDFYASLEYRPEEFFNCYNGVPWR